MCRLAARFCASLRYRLMTVSRWLLCCERQKINPHLSTPSQGWVAAEKAHCHTHLVKHASCEACKFPRLTAAKQRFQHLCLSLKTQQQLLIIGAQCITYQQNQWIHASFIKSRQNCEILNHLQVDNNGRSSSKGAPRRTTTWTKTKSDLSINCYYVRLSRWHLTFKKIQTDVLLDMTTHRQTMTYSSGLAGTAGSNLGGTPA